MLPSQFDSEKFRITIAEINYSGERYSVTLWDKNNGDVVQRSVYRFKSLQETLEKALDLMFDTMVPDEGF